MELHIWSDYVCPYCYIGKRHLEQALAEFRYAAEVEVVFRVFELDRTASRQHSSGLNTSTAGALSLRGP